MSLLKSQNLAQRKSQLGNKINLVRETIKNKKIDEGLDQTGYKELFKPITKSLSKITLQYKEKEAVQQQQIPHKTVHEYGLPPQEIYPEDILNVLQDDYDKENYETFDAPDFMDELERGK